MSNIPSERLRHYLLIQPRSQKEIADHFGVDRKTVRRAIDNLSLRELITDEKNGRHRMYIIANNDFNSPQFTPTELASLILSQEAILAGGSLSYGSPYASAGKTLIKKVRAAMPPRIRKNLDELSNIIGTAVIPNKDYSKFGAVIEELTTAALEKRTVSMIYAGLSSRKKENRLFNPFNIYFDPDGATLKTIGFDHKNSRISPFSLDRIQKIVITKDKFVRPKDFNLREFLEENCFNGIHNSAIKVQLRAFGTTARIFKERTFHSSQKILSFKKPQDNRLEEIEIEMSVAGGRGLERFILSWLPEIEVISPKSLRQTIANIISQSQK